MWGLFGPVFFGEFLFWNENGVVRGVGPVVKKVTLVFMKMNPCTLALTTFYICLCVSIHPRFLQDQLLYSNYSFTANIWFLNSYDVFIRKLVCVMDWFDSLFNSSYMICSTYYKLFSSVLQR